MNFWNVLETGNEWLTNQNWIYNSVTNEKIGKRFRGRSKVREFKGKNEKWEEEKYKKKEVYFSSSFLFYSLFGYVQNIYKREEILFFVFYIFLIWVKKYL